MVLRLYYGALILLLLRGARFSTLILFLLRLTIAVFFLNNQHLRVGLIQLEIFTLITALMAIGIGTGGLLRTVFILTLFTVAVVEATLGLSLLRLTSRSQTNELFKFRF